jgi:hypothetical protein
VVSQISPLGALERSNVVLDVPFHCKVPKFHLFDYAYSFISFVNLQLISAHVTSYAMDLSVVQ